MSKPKKEVSSGTYESIIDDLYYYLANLSKPELERFMADILTDSEIRMMHRRWHIAILLNSGMDFRGVAEIAQVSTGTVMNMKKMLQSTNGSMELALQKKKEKDFIEEAESKKTIA